MPRNRQSPGSLSGAIRPEQFDYALGHSTGEHHHDEHQLVFPSFGVLTVDTADGRWVVPPQRAVWIPAHVPHTVRSRSASRMSALYVDQRVRVQTLDDVAVLTVSPLLRELIHHLFTDLATGERDRVEAVLLDLLSASTDTPVSLPELSDSRLREVAAILEADPADDRSLRQFGAAVGASERTLQRLFHAETGATFGHWRTQLRLQHALISLGAGSSVALTARAVGYSEPSAFIAAFRRTFGTTPARYFDTP